MTLFCSSERSKQVAITNPPKAIQQREYGAKKSGRKIQDASI